MTNWIKYHSAVATLARHSYLTFTTDKAKFPDSNQPRANGGEDASDSTLKESVRMHTQHRHSHSVQTGLTNTLLEIKQDKAILHGRTPIAVTLGQACSIPIPPQFPASKSHMSSDPFFCQIQHAGDQRSPKHIIPY